MDGVDGENDPPGDLEEVGLHDTGRVDGNGRDSFPCERSLPAARPLGKETWQPWADVYRVPGGWLVKLGLAGVRPEDVRLDVTKEQALLAAPTRSEALRLLNGYLTHELQVLELRQKIASQAQNEMSKEQREYALRQQLRAIQAELR